MSEELLGALIERDQLEQQLTVAITALLDIAEETHPSLVMQLNDAKAYRNARLVAATAVAQIKRMKKENGDG